MDTLVYGLYVLFEYYNLTLQLVSVSICDISLLDVLHVCHFVEKKGGV
jgi:hypothetical protein